MSNVRINESLLSRAEREALSYLVKRIPSRIVPDHLTLIGLAGAFVTAVGFIACWASNWFLCAVILGLFLNWYGDSLDGSLARYRQIERPHYGYFIDHSTDLIAITLIVIGLGLSPFFTLSSSLFVLSLYLLMSSYTYLRVVTESIHRLSYGGMGATEFRMLIAGWSLLAAWIGPEMTSTRWSAYLAIDVVIGVLSAFTFLAFVAIVKSDLGKMQRKEALDQRKARARVQEEVRLELSEIDLADKVMH